MKYYCYVLQGNKSVLLRQNFSIFNQLPTNYLACALYVVLCYMQCLLNN